MAILEAIYHGWYESQQSYGIETKEVYKQFDKLWARAEVELAEEFSEGLRRAIFQVIDAECSQNFSEGFCLGALVMQEVHQTTASLRTAP